MLTVDFNPFPRLVSERLLLRQLAAADAPEIFKLRSNEQVNRFLARNRQQTLEGAGVFINQVNRNISHGNSIYWAISFKEDDRLIGTICLWNIQPENYRAEIGYELNPDCWGRGIMLEAISRVIIYGFNVMNLHSIEADLDPANARSIMLLEKNGFIKEGYFKDRSFFDGKFCDMAVYSLINPEQKT